MNKLSSIVCFVLILFSVVLLSGCVDKTNLRPQIQREELDTTPQEEQRFAIAGSGSNLPITSKLVEHYNATYSEKIAMPGSIGTSGAVKAVKENAIELGLASRPLKDEEQKTGLMKIPYARVAIVIGVNPIVPDTNITYQELVEIFKGVKGTWQNGKIIVVLSREEGDSTNRVLMRVIPGFAEALQESYEKKRWQIEYTDADEAEAIVATPFSIGFTDTGALRSLIPGIKSLNVNGSAPTIEKVNNGSYELYKDLYFIYQEPLSARARSFIDFVFSDQGAQIITASGGIPIEGR